MLYDCTLMEKKNEKKKKINVPHFWAFWHPIFKREKRIDVAERMKHAAMALS